MRAEGNETHAIRAKRSPRDLDAAISRIATRQDGVITLAQLLFLGLSRRGIDRRVGGLLHRVHRGVYAVGHRRLTHEGRWRAALFAAGDGAVLSHESAAALWELRMGNEREIEVTTPSRRRAPAGARIHRSAVPREDVRVRAGIRVTSPLRTIMDLAATLSQSELEKLIREAEYQRLTTAAAVRSRLSTAAPRRGRRELARAANLASQTQGRTESPLEDLFVAFLRRHRLPLPLLNQELDLGDQRIRPDCMWREQRLIAELDGGDAHRTTDAFHRDRARDITLQAAGWRVVRITRPSLEHAGPRLAGQIRQLLADR